MPRIPRLKELQSAEKRQLVIATKDLPGPADADGNPTVVHKKGEKVYAFPVDAREMVRSGAYAFPKAQDLSEAEQDRMGGDGRTGMPSGPPATSYEAAQASPAGDAPITYPDQEDDVDDGPGSDKQRAASEEANATGAKASASAAPAASEKDFTLESVPGVGAEIAAKLDAAGFGTVAKIRKASVEDMTAVPGVGTQYARRIKMHVDESYPAKGKG